MSVLPHRFFKSILLEMVRMFRVFIMPFSKQLFDNFSGIPILSDEMSDLVSTYKPKYDDDVMECLQFGICSTRHLTPKEIPYLHF